MKRISFGIAKALKEAGYPQSYMRGTFFNEQGEPLVVTDIKERIEYDIYAPTYFEVWLWIWREKGIHIDIDATIRDGARASIMLDNSGKVDKYINSKDPEEAIAQAIEFLVDNDLIK